MASVFIKVDAKERLPKKYGSYICLYNNSKNVQVTIFDRRSDSDFWRNAFDYWLEEIELPTEEDLHAEYEPRPSTRATAWRNGANFILDKLKGG